MENKVYYARVHINKKTGQKLITIPKKSDIEDGDYIKFVKINENEE